MCLVVRIRVRVRVRILVLALVLEVDGTDDDATEKKQGNKARIRRCEPLDNTIHGASRKDLAVSVASFCFRLSIVAACRFSFFLVFAMSWKL